MPLAEQVVPSCHPHAGTQRLSSHHHLPAHPLGLPLPEVAAKRQDKVHGRMGWATLCLRIPTQCCMAMKHLGSQEPYVHTCHCIICASCLHMRTCLPMCPAWRIAMPTARWEHRACYHAACTMPRIPSARQHRTCMLIISCACFWPTASHDRLQRARWLRSATPWWALSRRWTGCAPTPTWLQPTSSSST